MIKIGDKVPVYVLHPLTRVITEATIYGYYYGIGTVIDADVYGSVQVDIEITYNDGCKTRKGFFVDKNLLESLGFISEFAEAIDKYLYENR